MIENTGFISYMRKYKHLIFPIVASITLLLGGCSDNDDDPASAGETAVDILNRGWDNFETGDFETALEDFESAYDRDGTLADALNGAGWASGRMDNSLNQAENYFAQCLNQDSTRYDALGGWVFVAFQQGDWATASTLCQEFAENDPICEFYLRFIQQAGGAPPDDWDGIIRFRDKP